MSQVFIRKDSSTGKNWDNQHGAIQAIEEHLEIFMRRWISRWRTGKVDPAF